MRPRLCGICLLALLVGCGGGGGGDGGTDGPFAVLHVQTTSLPSIFVGDTVEWEIVLDGGCGGPYAMSIVAGELPEGLSLDDSTRDLGNGYVEHRHHLAGTATAADLYEFTLAVTDTACSPDSSASVALSCAVSDFQFASTTLPSVLSGQYLDYELDLNGGCGGPYEITLISGRLPDGIEIDDSVEDLGGDVSIHHRDLKGYLLEDGSFTFTLSVEDLSCPFAAVATGIFSMTVGVGPVAIVACNPSLTPVDEFSHPSKYDDVAALPTTAYNQYITYELTVAGGQGPYSMIIVDDPADPDDGPLPLGCSIPPSTTAINGAPVQYGPAGRPFRITLEVTDSVGAKGRRKLQWLIDP